MQIQYNDKKLDIIAESINKLDELNFDIFCKLAPKEQINSLNHISYYSFHKGQFFEGVHGKLEEKIKAFRARAKKFLNKD